MFKILSPDAKVSQADLDNAQKRFEWLTTYLICEFKFVHMILAMMVKIPQRGMNTMGVLVTPENGFVLHYDPAWMSFLTDQELTFIFYHEVLHLVLHHCTKRPLTTDKKDRHLANIAHDLAVNELVPVTNSCKIPLDEKGKIAGTFVSELKKRKEYKDIEEKQTSEWYWDYLRQKQKELGSLPGLDTCDGDCAKCKLEKGEPGSGDGMKTKAHCPKFDSHEEWGENEVADERVTNKVKEIDRTDMWGTMSQGVREIILAAQIKKVNWRNKIRVWFGNHSWKDRISTRKRPNRRTGFIHPGFKKTYRDRYLVAADDSGSIDAELLSEWLGVINQLVETLPIDFMQFDWEKQTEPVPYDRRRVQLEFKGRGGTNFQPVIDLVDERHYKGVMILTDGQAEAPTRPKNAHVLWVLPAGCKPPVDWGDIVYLEKHV